MVKLTLNDLRGFVVVKYNEARKLEEQYKKAKENYKKGSKMFEKFERAEYGYMGEGNTLHDIYKLIDSMLKDEGNQNE